MKYKLYNEEQFSFSALQQILFNRGIPLENQETWLNASWPQINNPMDLGSLIMVNAVNLVKGTIERNENILVIVDCD